MVTGKRDYFDFDIVKFFGWFVPRFSVCRVYISQIIRFARVSVHVTEFNDCNKIVTSKLLQQSYRYHKLRRTFSKFYRLHYESVSKFKVGLKPLLQQSLSEEDYYVTWSL